MRLRYWQGIGLTIRRSPVRSRRSRIRMAPAWGGQDEGLGDSCPLVPAYSYVHVAATIAAQDQVDFEIFSAFYFTRNHVRWLHVK